MRDRSIGCKVREFDNGGSWNFGDALCHVWRILRSFCLQQAVRSMARNALDGEFAFYLRGGAFGGRCGRTGHAIPYDGRIDLGRLSGE